MTEEPAQPETGITNKHKIKNLDELIYNLVKSMDNKIHLIIITRNKPDIEIKELQLK